jgi:hypothetical protein
VASTGNDNSYGIFVEKSEGKSQLGKCEDNSEADLKRNRV